MEQNIFTFLENWGKGKIKIFSDHIAPLSELQIFVEK